jgi:DNA-binding transcriptional LysR family regulator
VARLEARLRVSLLLRSTQGVSLTDAGHAYLADCVRLLAAVDAAEASALGLQVQAQGHVRVFLPVLFSRYVMAPILADYMDRHPDVRLTVRYHDYYPNLHEEGLDVAILVGELPNSSLIARPVGQVRSILCASPGYLAAHGEPRHPEALKQHRLIAGANRVDWDFQGYSLKARARLSCSTVQGAINAAVQGAGLIRCLSYRFMTLCTMGNCAGSYPRMNRRRCLCRWCTGRPPGAAARAQFCRSLRGGPARASGISVGVMLDCRGGYSLAGGLGAALVHPTRRRLP